MKIIPLTQGKVAIVDDCDFERLSRHKWHAEKTILKNRVNWRASRTVKENGVRKTRYMHTEILPNAKEVDHRDGDGLNNRRSNLRPCTHQQNIANSVKAKGTTSKYKGVYWVKDRAKWGAGIRVNYKRINLGRFDTEIEAANAYLKAAKSFWGDFARAA